MADKLKEMDGILVAPVLEREELRARLLLSDMLVRTMSILWNLSWMQMAVIEFARNVLGMEDAMILKLSKMPNILL